MQLCLGTWRRHGQQGAPLVFSSCCAAEAGAEAEAGGGKSGCPGAQLFEARGEPGQPRPAGVQKFVVEFAGETLAALARSDTNAGPGAVAAQVEASRGAITRSRAEPVPGTRRWRAVFDLDATGTEAVELRLFLADAQGNPLSETWLYQHLPQRQAA